MASRPQPIGEGEFHDAEIVWLPKTELLELLNGALAQALPEGAGCGFNFDGDRAWIRVTRPGNTTQVLSAAREALGNT